jgi:hypothetical protein
VRLPEVVLGRARARGAKPALIDADSGRNFRQPREGLGFDGSLVAHMWRTMIWPNNFI